MKLNFDLEFHQASEEPTEPGDYLLYNQCDGYHVAEAWFPEGEFCGFYFWPHDHVSPNFYCAWAKLPDTVKTLYDVFAKKD
jgi:hypothetical protein